MSLKGVVLTRLFSSILVVATVTGAAACRKPPASSGSTATAVPAAQAAAAGQTAQPAAPAPPPPKPMPAQLPPVLARVNGEDVTKVDFDRLILAIWVPLERQAEAEAFVANVNKAIESA